MLTENDIRKALEPFSKNLKYVERIKNCIFYAVFDASVDEDKVKETLKEKLNPEDVEVDRKALEVSIKIIDRD